MENSCRLCRTTISDENYEKIEDITKDIFDVLLLKLNVEVRRGQVMCLTCSSELSRAIRFKSRCLYTDNTIIPYAEAARSMPLDLKEIYIQEKDDECELKNIIVCRLCMQPINSAFKAINREQIDILERFVPEMNFHVIKDPVMCKICSVSLADYFNFREKCLGAEHGNKSGTTNETIDTQDCVLLVDLSIEIEDIEVKGSEVELPLSVKSENLVEKDEGELKVEILDLKEEHTSSDVALCEDITPQKQDRRCYKCSSCDYKANTKSAVTKHKFAKHKTTLKQHLHKTETTNRQIQHEARNELLQQVIQHGNVTKTSLYKCGKCSLKYKHKSTFEQHTCKGPKEGNMYKCEHCDYKSKFKRYLQAHLKVHDPSKRKKYKCEVCNYEYANKKNLTYHLTLHKDFSESELYKCEKCEFKSKYKRYLKIHMSMHKESLEKNEYKCEISNYSATFEDDFTGHISEHKHSFDSRIYKCE